MDYAGATGKECCGNFSPGRQGESVCRTEAGLLATGLETAGRIFPLLVKNERNCFALRHLGKPVSLIFNFSVAYSLLSFVSSLMPLDSHPTSLGTDIRIHNFVKSVATVGFKVSLLIDAMVLVFLAFGKPMI